MPEPRKHHYLPQFYLRGFSTDGKRIYQIEKRTSHGYTCSIRDAAAIRDYHELDDPSCEDPNAVEKRLAEMETQLAAALVRVLRRGLETPDDHASVVQLVALLRVRIPAFKTHIDAFLQQMVRSVGLIMGRKGQLPPAPKGLEDVLRVENLSISIANWKCLEFMFKLAADRRILALLGAMTPLVLRAPERAVFLTCDQPVAVYHPEASPTDAYGSGGLADPVTEVSVPLSSRVLLLLSRATDPPATRVATFEEVVEFNRRTVIMADSLVFAPEASESAVETVARYAHCGAGIALDFLDAGTDAVHLARFRPVMRADRYSNGPPN